MKIFIYSLLTVIGVVVLALVTALFLPKEFQAGNKIIINEGNDAVYTYVSSLKNQANFDPWSEQDVNISRTFKGTDQTVGFVYEWESEKVGNGKQVITALIPNKRVEIDIFFNGSTLANKSFFEIKSLNENQTEVLWQINGNVPYPFNLLTQFYNMDKDFKRGLERLKLILEKQ